MVLIPQKLMKHNMELLVVSSNSYGYHFYIKVIFLIKLLLGPKTGYKRPIVKILKVEDLKNDDIVERIKRELGQQLSFKLESGATKLLSSGDITKKSTENLKSSVAPVAFPSSTDHCTVIPTENAKTQHNRSSSESIQSSVQETKNSTVLVKSTNQDTKDTPEGTKIIKPDPDLKECMKPPEKGANYIVLNRKFHLERMKRFVTMTKGDLPTKAERKFKCEGPLSELKAPVDTIRCSKCGVLYESDILVSHLKTCQGDRRKTKYGCRLCSFTDCDYKQLEAHIKNVHPKRLKKQS